MYTLVFGATFALLGLLHYFEWELHDLAALLFCVITFGYIGLVLAWYWSVRTRLLPTRARLYIAAAAWLMVFFLVLRTVRYHFVQPSDAYVYQWTWYLYYVPYLFIPALFLMACIYSTEWRGATDVHVDERWLLVVPAVFFLLVCTNEWHYLVFEPFVTVPITGQPDTYGYGPFYYVIWTIFVSEAVLGVGLLVSVTKKTQHWLKALIPVGVILAYALVLTFDNYTSGNGSFHNAYSMPELSVFGMLAVFECSIRLRLIPYNENYAGVFAKMRLAAVITDNDLVPRWRTETAIEARREDLAQATEGEKPLDRDTVLWAHRLGEAGYVFYTEDRRDIHALNDRLAAANATIEEENALIKRENELQVEAARVRQRNEIYRNVREVMATRQRKINELLTEAEPNTPAFRPIVAEVLVRQAFVKRGSNMLLTMADGGKITYADMDLAMDEPLRYLKYRNIHAGVNVLTEGALEAETAFALYQTFEDVIEALMPVATRIVVAFEGGKLRISANAKKRPSLPETALPVLSKTEDGGCYFLVDGTGEVAV